MHVEKLKYLIWAQDMERAVRFYREVFDAVVVRQSKFMAELTVGGGAIGNPQRRRRQAHLDGPAFQVGDLFAACDLLTASGAPSCAAGRDARGARIWPCAPIRKATSSC